MLQCICVFDVQREAYSELLGTDGLSGSYNGFLSMLGQVDGVILYVFHTLIQQMYNRSMYCLHLS